CIPAFMSSALSFLIAARRCEIDELEQLGRTSALVETVAQLVHALQLERGLANVFLQSRGARMGKRRQARLGETLAAEAEVQRCFDSLLHSPMRLGQGARLCNRVAAVILEMD